MSARGWLVLLLAALGAGIFVARNVQPFLAKNQRVDSNILVVEGWVHEYAIRAAAAEFQTGRYEKIYTTGGPVVGTGGYVNDFNTSASVGAELLVKAGVRAEQVQMVPAHAVGRDRTFYSAVTLREYFRTNGLAGKNFNVLTEDAHARRTQRLFQVAFGPTAVVGILSVPDPDYDPAHWWRSSEGVREVLSESIAYVYAQFLFRPQAQVP